MRFYLLKLGTDHGYEGFAAMPGMGLERKGLGPMMGSCLMGINPLDMQLVNFVGAARDAAGDKLDIMIDANQG